MNFSFHPEAEHEFIEAAAYYEDCEPGLGLDFSREVYAPFRTPWTTRACGLNLKTRCGAVLFTVFPTAYCTASSLTAYSSSPSCTCTVTQTTGDTDTDPAEPAPERYGFTAR